MTKTLVKKQMMEVFSWIYRDKKSGKNRSKRGMILYILLYLVIFVALGEVFYFMAGMLCQPLTEAGLGWLYFALMGLVAVALGVFGSVFNTYASLYLAKDNELLLAMPVPPARILLVRLAGVFAIGLMYELIVMVPTLIVWFGRAELPVMGVICSLLIPLVLSVLVLTLSAVLGWVVAMVSSRLKHKNLVVVVLSLAFIAAYYYGYSRAYAMLQSILVNARAVGDSVRSALYPFYHMGLAAQGHLDSMLIFTGIVAVLFAVIYVVLARSFLKLATVKTGGVRARYQERPMAMHSVGRALLGKELRRFLGSATYMLNCGLGIVMMLVGAVALVIKADTVNTLLDWLPQDTVFLMAAAAVPLLATMNDLTAPSVSLEGKTLWLSQSLPVPARQVLMAKLHLHLMLTLIPAAVLVAALEWVLKPPAGFALLIPAAAAAFILLMAAFGLAVGLKLPNLTWTSEIVPIKQSMGVMIALFGGWVLVAALAGAWWLLQGILSPVGFLGCVVILLLAAFAALLGWIRTRGARIFEQL